MAAKGEWFYLQRLSLDLDLARSSSASILSLWIFWEEVEYLTERYLECECDSILLMQ